MYEVYALKYGERDTTACQFFYREASHAPITLHYYVWLILGGPHPILVDTGFLDDDARARGIRNYVSPAAMVERAGVKPGEVPVALITHLHYDHWAGHSLFPSAEYWIQGDEVAFWTGPFGRRPVQGRRAGHHQDRLNAPKPQAGRAARSASVEILARAGHSTARGVALLAQQDLIEADGAALERDGGTRQVEEPRAVDPLADQRAGLVGAGP